MSKSVSELKIDASVFTLLACPACQGDLHFQLNGNSRGEAPANPGRVHCVECGRAYPMADGIPVLIVERALLADSRG
jgi:uncharacterized protein YbaR (Trm112 family)